MGGKTVEAMKQFLTSCYGRVKQLPKGSVLVQTSTSAPPWLGVSGMKLEAELAPKSFLTNPNAKDWREKYRAQLVKLHKAGTLKEIVDRLPDGAVLLCYEADHCECHRKLLADFLVEHKLAIVKEWNEKPKPDFTQMNLL
jgi:hypothetical protein